MPGTQARQERNARGTHTLIQLHVEPGAPRKPAEGAACNGCGVCCLMEPCPIGMVMSRKRTGACDALVWSADEQRYHCGMVTAPQHMLSQALPRAPQRLLQAATPLVARLARRMISAGSGCDCDVRVDSDDGQRSGDGDVNAYSAGSTLKT